MSRWTKQRKKRRVEQENQRQRFAKADEDFKVFIDGLLREHGLTEMERLAFMKRAGFKEPLP